jgi:hypothetical protein
MGRIFAAHRTNLFVALWLFAIFVSVLDGYLALQNREVLPREELNPVGQMLIAIGGGTVWCLLVAKFAGTVVASSLALLIHQNYPRWSLTIVAAVAASQLGLLLFLLLA